MTKKKVLLLGMFYSMEKEPSLGQGYRDRVRCEAMESLGYTTYTLDDKHDASMAVEGRHCQTNFSDHRRMIESINNTWTDDILRKGFSIIILDYFFSPSGWTEYRWTINFFRCSLPTLATENVIANGGFIWLPYVDHVHKMIEDCRTVLEQYYDWEPVTDAKRNPLVHATNNALSSLQLCPGNMTNETQLRPLLGRGTPFYVLKRKIGVPHHQKLLHAKTNKLRTQISAATKTQETALVVQCKPLLEGSLDSGRLCCVRSALITDPCQSHSKSPVMVVENRPSIRTTSGKASILHSFSASSPDTTKGGDCAADKQIVRDGNGLCSLCSPRASSLNSVQGLRHPTNVPSLHPPLKLRRITPV